MSSLRPAPVVNLLLATLAPRARGQFLRQCTTVHLKFGDVLAEARGPAVHVYFPLLGFISLMGSVTGHRPLELGLIGNEGMLGATLALGLNESPSHAVVQGSGTALRMTGGNFTRELQGNKALRSISEKYLYVTLIQLARNSVCTRFHPTEQRLARWLLMTHDRAHADRFSLTHQYLSDMLGVRRSSISIAAEGLQRRKLIRYSRGSIDVINRPMLEAAACECYAAVSAEYTRMFVRT